MIKKCLFPAAGYGTRFLPATKSMPKEMMPVVNKPLIEYGGNDSNLLIVFYVQIMPDDFVMQLHRF